ncbi:MAG TPA: glycosyltransferase [Azospirillaceae bacterium]|nr:glycosyltransferase [Azospirillaceae bacterium]
MPLQRRDQARVLIYSHDTFGLGHLRRCRAIAHALVQNNKGLSVLILSGSPIIGSFDFPSRVDFVRVPGVIKLRNGEYTSLNLHVDTEQTLAIRASIMRHTADIFDPDLFIVDKEPLGLRGELEDTLTLLKNRGTPIVLGLRDVLDDPDLLAPEWQRKNVLPALERFYDELWVYGLPQVCDPLAGIALPRPVRRRMVYTGYLRREMPASVPPQPEGTDDPYILVTPGGGGDGEAMVDWVLRAYESDRDLPCRALIVLGPFMHTEAQAEFIARAAGQPKVEVVTFDAKMERLMRGAVGVVAMGGYNTFCEILSFDKPALIVPRTMPRMEQFIRASRARDLGLMDMLADDGVRAPEVMAAALRRLPHRAPPSRVVMPGLLAGVENVQWLAERWLQPGLGRRPLTIAVRRQGTVV